MVSPKLTTEERILRKRQAARVRQQRCRARKRQALLERQKKSREADRTNKGVSRNESGVYHTADHNIIQKCPSYTIQHSPRSVFWNDVPNGSWAIPARKLDYTHRYPRFEPNRRVYGPAAESRSIYYRFPPSPQQHHAQPISNSFTSIKHKPVGFYAYPNLESRDSETCRAPPGPESCRQGWMSPKISMLKKPEIVNKAREVAIESKEEAAVDAILSLKSAQSEKSTTIVPPPKIQRISAEPTSAFKEYRGPRPRPTRPGFYLTMRV